jgi:hypothetical protein
MTAIAQAAALGFMSKDPSTKTATRPRSLAGWAHVKA